MTDPTPPPIPPSDPDDGQVGWYFAEAGTSYGPWNEEQMLQFAEDGRIQDKTSVWSEGMADWAPWHKVAPWLQPPAPAPSGTAGRPLNGGEEGPDATAGEGTFGGRGAASAAPSTPARPSQPAAPAEVSVRTRQAWLRFAARFVDLFLVGVVAAGVGQAMSIGPQGQWFMLLALTVLWIFVEAWFLSRWGMTPGKWIFRLRVVHEEGRLLNYLEARHRSTQVLLQGMGLNIFPFNLIFNALAFKELVEFGKTAWDRQRHMEIQQATMRGPQVAAAAVIGLVILASALLTAFDLVGAQG